MAPQRATCCVVGGGPAGLMLGYLLARSGIQVTVLEKHQNFNGDFPFLVGRASLEVAARSKYMKSSILTRVRL